MIYPIEKCKIIIKNIVNIRIQIKIIFIKVVNIKKIINYCYYKSIIAL